MCCSLQIVRRVITAATFQKALKPDVLKKPKEFSMHAMFEKIHIRVTKGSGQSDPHRKMLPPKGGWAQAVATLFSNFTLLRLLAFAEHFGHAARCPSS